jgi:DNA-binding CsgD family transcriptional regulator
MSTARERALLWVVRAAYDVEVPTEDWIARVMHAAAPALDFGLGIAGMTFRVDSDRLTITSPVVATDGVPRGLAQIVMENAKSIPPEHVRVTWGGPESLGSASSIFRRSYPNLRFAAWEGFEACRQLGIRDQVAAKAIDPSGAGCILMANLDREIDVDRRRSRRWSRVMAHVLAGLRLRSALEAPEAVVDLSGRVVHAEGEAQSRSSCEALRQAALRIDRAKRKQALENPHIALEEWRALVAGRWSLVDSFERDGRRYLMARRNDPRLEFPRALSERQRQIVAYAAQGHSNKYIAYALGLAPSTVATHLAAAMQRLGAHTRTDLVRLWLPHSETARP